MPGIADELHNPRPARGGTKGRIEVHLDRMPDDLRALALELLASDSSDAAVARAFTHDGYPVGSTTPVRNYRISHGISRFAEGQS